MHLDLADLRLFRHVAEAGSITAGAERAGLALASASARVRGMEQQVGVPLLVRGRRGVVPTPAGLTLLHHARRVAAQMALLRGELAEYAGGLQGHVRVLANTAAAAEILPGLLPGFLAGNPGLGVDVTERPSPAVVQGVAEGVAEIGIAAGHADLAGLHASPFRRDRLVLVAPRGHPLAARSTIGFAEALDHPFIAPAGDSALHRHLLDHALRAGGRMQVRARVPGLDAVCRMVADGAGLAVVPHSAARGRPLAELALDDPWAERLLHLVVRLQPALPPHARRLMAHLLAARDAGC